VPARGRGGEPAGRYGRSVKRAEALSAARARGDSGDASGEVDGVIGTSMKEADIERIMTWPYVNFCTDGSLVGRHPRGSGSFPKILGHYVRERGILTLPEAVRRLSGLAAANMGIRDRVRSRRGCGRTWCYSTRRR
jgi:N-acyl-D-amino-acid deacylase